MRPVVLLALLVTLGSPACKRLSTGAQEEFSKKYTCPEERVRVKERPDLDPVRAMASAFWDSPKTPPDEVKKDPGRYAMWKADREKELERNREGYAKNEMFEVTGCGHQQILGCMRYGKNGHVWCKEATFGK